MWYIHYEDAQFWEQPWPGERRSGPLLTKEEALNQAVIDAAYGASVTGIFQEKDSIRRDLDLRVEAAVVEAGDDLTEDAIAHLSAVVGDLHKTAPKKTAAKPTVGADEILKLGQQKRDEIMSLQVVAIAESRRQVEATLPDGVTWDDMLELAAEMAKLRRARA